MEAKAITKYIRISPRKLRLVIDTIRYKPLASAYGVLNHLQKKGARLTLKTLKSAHANAKFKKMDEARLYVREIKADGGPMMKRYLSRSMGRADVILKRMAHLTVVLAERTIAVEKPKSETPAGEKQEPKPKKSVKAPKTKATKEKKAAAAAH